MESFSPFPKRSSWVENENGEILSIPREKLLGWKWRAAPHSPRKAPGMKMKMESFSPFPKRSSWVENENGEILSIMRWSSWDYVPLLFIPAIRSPQLRLWGVLDSTLIPFIKVPTTPPRSMMLHVTLCESDTLTHLKDKTLKTRKLTYFWSTSQIVNVSLTHLDPNKFCHLLQSSCQG